MTFWLIIMNLIFLVSAAYNACKLNEIYKIAKIDHVLLQKIETGLYMGEEFCLPSKDKIEQTDCEKDSSEDFTEDDDTDRQLDVKLLG